MTDFYYATTETAPEGTFFIGMSLLPPKHKRATVFFRGVMSLPAFVVSLFFGLACVVTVPIAWFSALVTGHVSPGISNFNYSVLALQARVSAYSSLLTTKFPNLSLTPSPTDQVRVEVENVPLNRLAVLFRFFLGFPGLLLSVVFAYGTYVLLPVAWVVALITGRVPKAVHQALALNLRMRTRANAYFYLLSPRQAWEGLLGDAPGPDNGLRTPWVVTRAAKVLVAVMTLVGSILGAFEVYFNIVLASQMKYVSCALVMTTYTYDFTTSSENVNYMTDLNDTLGRNDMAALWFEMHPTLVVDSSGNVDNSTNYFDYLRNGLKGCKYLDHAGYDIRTLTANPAVGVNPGN